MQRVAYTTLPMQFAAVYSSFTLRLITMPSPLESFNKEEIISYALALMSSAASKLEVDDPEGAAWRIADALGALSLICGDGTQGIQSFTGLGYKLESVHDNTKQVPTT
jgi:hypothetical protein